MLNDDEINKIYGKFLLAKNNVESLINTRRNLNAVLIDKSKFNTRDADMALDELINDLYKEMFEYLKSLNFNVRLEKADIFIVYDHNHDDSGLYGIYDSLANAVNRCKALVLDHKLDSDSYLVIYQYTFNSENSVMQWEFHKKEMKIIE